MANYGFEVCNADGIIRDKVTSKFARIIAKLHIPLIVAYDYAYQKAGSGSFIVNELLNIPKGYIPFYFISPAELNGCFYPNVKISGNLISWDFYIYDRELFPRNYDKKNGVSDLFGDNPVGFDSTDVAPKRTAIFGGCYINVGICPDA